MKFQPYGLAGGLPAAAAVNLLEQGGNTVSLPSKVGMSITAGDLVTHIQPGGGGFGDPLERDLRDIARDVWNQKISAQFARTHYRVVVDAASGVIDADATRTLRAQPG